MHELSIARCIVELALSEAHAHRAGPIRRIRIRVGSLRQVDEGLLQEAFAAARLGTAAADAELLIDRVNLIVDCQDCRHRSCTPIWCFECPNCGSSSVSLTGGDELELLSLEAEVEDDHRSAEKEPVGDER